MTCYRAEDLAVVIPTRDRWDILALTIDALTNQVPVGGDAGAEVIVVVDGDDQRIPESLGPVRTLPVPRGGPGAARNRGVDATDKPLVLFLGDDIIPEPGMIDRHLARHTAEPEAAVAVLGQVRWHPRVSTNPANRWLDRSGMQFDYATIPDGEDAGWTRFYSCNVSLKSSFFQAAGGFDADFTYYYEDLDAGWRLAQAGLCLRYEPGALGSHLHSYDLKRLRARFAGVAVGERMMAEKHEWFEPWFERIFRSAACKPAVPSFWARLPQRVGPDPLRRAVAARSDLWYLQQVAPAFLAVWDRERAREAL